METTEIDRNSRTTQAEPRLLPPVPPDLPPAADLSLRPRRPQGPLLGSIQMRFRGRQMTTPDKSLSHERLVGKQYEEKRGPLPAPFRRVSGNHPTH